MSRKQFRPDGSNKRASSDESATSESGPASAAPSNSEMQSLMAEGASLPAVQKFSDGKDAVGNAAATRAVAAQGAEGGGVLPHKSALEKAFGMDFSNVSVTLGGSAKGANEAMGSAAYTQGEHIAFRDANPSKELVAHELTHVVQQRGGEAPAGGVGKKGDSGEQEADAVAARAAKGESVAAEVGGDGARGSASGSEAVQHYIEEEVRGSDARVSDSGKSIRVGSQDLYLTGDLIQYANNKLRSSGKDGSYVTLVEEGGKLSYGDHTLARVMPKFVPHQGEDLHSGLEDANNGGKDSMGNASDKFALWSDCGRSSAAVMGSQYTDRAAVYNRNGKEVERKGMKDRNITGAGDSIPGQMANQVYLDGMSEFLWKNVETAQLKEGLHYKVEGGKKKPIWPQNALHARQQYAALEEEDRQAVDKQLGINAFAAPDVGEGFTMATEYQMPGAAEVPGKNRWNFHWGGIVAKDGADVISLENYAVTADYAATMGVKQFDFVDREWVFEMYGTRRYEQSFHAQHLGTGTHGTKATTMRVRTQT